MKDHKYLVFSFADVEVREREFSVIKAGKVLTVEPKAFRVLLFLLRKPHTVVTKDELLDAVWNDVSVSENSLTRNIALLRRLLEDDTHEPRYIATVPTIGYRFICDVEVTEDGFRGLDGDHPHPPPPTSEVGVRQDASVQAATPALRATQGRASGWCRAGARRYSACALGREIVAAAVGVVVIAGLGIGGWIYYPRKAHVLSDADTVVLADFTNTTGDMVFDSTLRQGLAVQLEQSPFLRIISDQQIQQTLKMMGQPPDARLTPEIARDLCQRSGSKAYLSGSIASLGSQYVLGLRAVNCVTGETLAEEQERASGKEQVLSAMDKAAPKLRTKLGESLNTVQKFDTPLAQATTPSLEALQAYSLGRKIGGMEGDHAAAIPLFQRAIQLDPNFAMAYIGCWRRAI